MEGIKEPADFTASKHGRVVLDSIAMVILAVGETVKRIDRSTRGDYLFRYTNIPWKQIMGARDRMAHDYFGINAAEVFRTATISVPELAAAVERMIQDLDASPAEE